MAIRSDHRPWLRLLDGDMHVAAQPELRLYPTGSDNDPKAALQEVLESLEQARNSNGGINPQARAVGSHWAASEAAVTVGTTIETATPTHESDGNQAAGRLNRVLYDVLPSCLAAGTKRFFMGQYCPKFTGAPDPVAPGLPLPAPKLSEIYLFHVEAGIRIYELYAYLDGADELSKDGSLGRICTNGDNPWYGGPWALETMGGAGGQTIVGVASTATHGGDVDYGAISDSVVAMHLIDQEGTHHWIERTSLGNFSPGRIFDEAALKAHFGKIEYHSDNDLLNAAIVSCGRMGMIYSVVLRVVRQYALKESIHKTTWKDAKAILADPSLPVWQNRFVRMDVNAYGGPIHPSEYDCYIMTRSLAWLNDAGSPPRGRNERGGVNAGKQPNLKAGGSSGGWFSNPCDSDNYIRTALTKMRHDFVTDRLQALKALAVATLAVAFGLGPVAVAAQGAALAAVVALTALINAITAILALIGSSKATFGDTLADVANFCASTGLWMIYRAVYEMAQKSEHEAKPTAISYAVMDDHDYLNVGCVSPAETIEFFFDADSAQLPAFIDHVLARVGQLSNGDFGGPAAFGGYISLRFMTKSPALLAMQRWARTCSIEIAGLSHVSGTDTLIHLLAEDAKSFDTVLHWGQYNPWPQKQIEKVYGAGPGGALYAWRGALSTLSHHGRLAMFSTSFTKFKGLEITKPIIGSFVVTPTDACFDELLAANWDAMDNPPETAAFIIHTHGDGSQVKIALDGLVGSRALTLGKGRSTFTLRLERPLNGRLYVDERSISVRGFQSGDPWTFKFTAEQRVIDGVDRWVAEMNLFSQFISDVLRVSAVESVFDAQPSWRLRNADTGDVLFTAAANRQPLPGLPKFNTNWLLFSDQAAVGPAPQVSISFTLACAH